MFPQTVLITGASRGLGAATARAISRLGANLVLAARSADALTALVREIQNTAGQAISVVGDVSHPEDCQKMVVQTIQTFGRLDALINNAGVIGPIATIAQADLQVWETNLATNLLGPVALTQTAIPYLRETEGKVINVSSGAAVNLIPGLTAYSMAKAALNHFTRLLAAEESLITAISVQMGAVNTDMQSTIRREGAGRMPEQVYARFVRLYQDRQLVPAELPARALAALSLFAPHEWSGELISWNDDRVQALTNRVFG